MTAVANVADFAQRPILKTQLNGTAYLIVKYESDYYAIENRCPHLGMSMARATIEDGHIVCPWHGSRFALRTGENVGWVNAFAGIPMPRWSHKLIALGKKPTAITSIKLEVRGDSIHLPASLSQT